MADEAYCSVEILRSAQYEIEDIARMYVSLAGKDYARKIIEEIYSAMEQLSIFPLSGPSIRDSQLKAAGYRYLVIREYIMIYRKIGSTVYIYHIAHGKTDYPVLMKSEL